MKLAYKNERPLFIIHLFLSLLIWLVFLGATFGMLLIWVLIFFIIYLFVQSAFISYIKGTAVRISEQQYPEIYQMHLQCCSTLDIKTPPEIYLLNGDGLLNALATRFMGRNFVVLFTDVVDALQRQPAAIKFYIGHELGHIKQGHLGWGPFLFPSSILPLIGAAYSRAKEYTCDIHGQACCDKPQDAVAGVAVLAAGVQVWNKLNVSQYAEQSMISGSFWMALHELVSDYPWLAKRMRRIIAQAKGEKPKFPRRNPFAYLFALFVPRLGLGRGSGGLVSLMIVIAIIGILAAIAIPAYQGYIAKTQVNAAMDTTQLALGHVEEYIVSHQSLPESLAATGYEAVQNNAIQSLDINAQGVIVLRFAKAPLEGQTLEFSPYLDEEKRIRWDCKGGSLSPQHRPAECK